MLSSEKATRLKLRCQTDLRSILHIQQLPIGYPRENGERLISSCTTLLQSWWQPLWLHWFLRLQFDSAATAQTGCSEHVLLQAHSCCVGIAQAPRRVGHSERRRRIAALFPWSDRLLLGIARRRKGMALALLVGVCVRSRSELMRNINLNCTGSLQELALWIVANQISWEGIVDACSYFRI